MKAGQGSCLEEQIKILLLYLYKVHYKVRPVLFKKIILQINEEVPCCPSALRQGEDWMFAWPFYGLRRRDEEWKFTAGGLKRARYP